MIIMARMLMMFPVYLTVFLALSTTIHAGWFSDSDSKAVTEVSDKQSNGAVLFGNDENEASRYTVTKFPGPVELLAFLHGLPDCQKVITTMLMKNCEAYDAFDTKPQSPSARYAAGLAVCELLGAQAPIPMECKAFVPDLQTGGKTAGNDGGYHNMLTDPSFSFDEFDVATASATQSCINALFTHDKNQFWTSYSNNKQSAYHICTASSSAIRGETLLKVMTDSIDNAHSLFNQHKDLDSAIQQTSETMAMMSKEQADRIARTLKDADELSKKIQSNDAKLDESHLKVLSNILDVEKELTGMITKSTVQATMEVELFNARMIEAGSNLQTTSGSLASIMNTAGSIADDILTLSETTNSSKKQMLEFKDVLNQTNIAFGPFAGTVDIALAFQSFVADLWHFLPVLVLTAATTPTVLRYIYEASLFQCFMATILANTMLFMLIERSSEVSSSYQIFGWHIWVPLAPEMAFMMFLAGCWGIVIMNPNERLGAQLLKIIKAVWNYGTPPPVRQNLLDFTINDVPLDDEDTEEDTDFEIEDDEETAIPNTRRTRSASA